MNEELDDLRAAWQDQTRDDRRFTPEALRAAETRLERAVTWRDRREFAASAFVIPFFGAMALSPSAHAVSRVGALLIVVATVFIVGRLWRSGRSKPRDDLAASGLAWQTVELTRERDLLGGVWRWYLGPLVPGLALFMLGPVLASETWAGRAVLAAVVAAQGLLLAWIGQANARAVRAIDAELADLGKNRWV